MLQIDGGSNDMLLYTFHGCIHTTIIGLDFSKIDREILKSSDRGHRHFLKSTGDIILFQN